MREAVMEGLHEMTWGQETLVALIGIMVLADLYHGWTRRESLVTAKLVVLVGLAMFVAFPDIAKVEWSDKGLSIERQATAVLDVMANVAALGTSPTEDQVTRLFDRGAGVGTEAWVRLVTIRMALRNLLRSACTKVPDCERRGLGEWKQSSEQQICCLRDNQTLDPLRFQELDRLRQATEFAEWGGEAPPIEDLEFALREGPRILKELAQVGSKRLGYSLPTCVSPTPAAATPTPTTSSTKANSGTQFKAVTP